MREPCIDLGCHEYIFMKEFRKASQEQVSLRQQAWGLLAKVAMETIKYFVNILWSTIQIENKCPVFQMFQYFLAAGQCKSKRTREFLNALAYNPFPSKRTTEQ